VKMRYAVTSSISLGKEVGGQGKDRGRWSEVRGQGRQGGVF